MSYDDRILRIYLLECQNLIGKAMYCYAEAHNAMNRHWMIGPHVPLAQRFETPFAPERVVYAPFFSRYPLTSHAPLIDTRIWSLLVENRRALTVHWRNRAGNRANRWPSSQTYLCVTFP